MDGVLTMERLPCCHYGVPEPGRGGEGQCGDPAEFRASWDDGKTWLYLCERHAAVVEAGEAPTEIQP